MTLDRYADYMRRRARRDDESARAQPPVPPNAGAQGRTAARAEAPAAAPPRPPQPEERGHSNNGTRGTDLRAPVAPCSAPEDRLGPAEAPAPARHTPPAHRASPPQPAADLSRQTVPEVVPQAVNAVPQTQGRPRPDEIPSLVRRLRHVTLDPRHLARNRVISAGRDDPAHVAFDVLRTRLLAALRENGWRRVAITSPTPDCGKTFLAANLAVSLSRQDHIRTLLMDLDLRRPSLAQTLGVKDPGRMGGFLAGDRPATQHILRIAENDMRIGPNLFLGLNDSAETCASELMNHPQTDQVLDALYRDLDPDVVLFDMPPGLYYDDVMAFRQHIDGVFVVIGGGSTTADEMREFKQRLTPDMPLLGTILNRADAGAISNYSY